MIVTGVLVWCEAATLADIVMTLSTPQTCHHADRSLWYLPMQAYRRTYSWAQNSDASSWRGGAFITISREPALDRTQEEEDMERGYSREEVNGHQVSIWT